MVKKRFIALNIDGILIGVGHDEHTVYNSGVVVSWGLDRVSSP